MTEHSFYVISDRFFLDFPDPYLMGNKEEQRPHYYAIQDKKTGLYWMIPLSSRIEKYTALKAKIEANGKKCNTLHICKLGNDRESVFLVQNIFPISEKYIVRPFTVGGKPMRLSEEDDIKIIRKKVVKTLGMIRRGVRFSTTMPDVLLIEKKLLEQK